MTFLATLAFGIGLLLVTTAIDNVAIGDAITEVLQGQPITPQPNRAPGVL